MHKVSLFIPPWAKRYNPGSTECVQVKNEDRDWQVYHILADDPDQDEETLSGKAGCTRDVVEASLSRLEAAFLVGKGQAGWRVLSIPETILCSQARYDTSAPFSIENGVIRLRKGQE